MTTALSIPFRTLISTGALALFMLATRSDHFGSAVNLPDASVAVFFLAGFFLRQRWVFPALCGLAVASDYWAVAHNGVSAFCVTPAYGFLLPTYFVLWWSGRHSGQRVLASRGDAMWLAGTAVLSVVTAFLISSGSFYLLAPYFQERSLVEFGARVVDYLPAYAGFSLMYIAATLGLYQVLSLVGHRAEGRVGHG